MVFAIDIKLKIGSVRRLLDRIDDRIFPEIEAIPRDFTKLAAKRMRQQLLINRTNYTGKLFRSIQSKKIAQRRYAVIMEGYGFGLDEGPPRFVSLVPGRKITKWAKDNFGTRVVTGKSIVHRGPKGGITGGVIFVTPHPFIDSALDIAVPEFERIINRRISNIFGG